VRRVVVTDTVPFKDEHERITVLSVAPLLASAIRNVHDNGSVSALFT
jgi:ribose-phosphate pyrophosphokinase